MKDHDISPEKLVAGDKSGIDLSESRPSLEALLKEHEQHLAALPDSAKWILSFGMLLGRLEIFTVIVLFTPTYWRA